MDLNKVMLIGNITRDPELRSTPSGQSVASFGLATNRVWKDPSSGERKSAAEFHNIVAWRKLAEICGQYLRKGSKVYVEGRLQTRNWQGQDGNKRYMTEVIMENMIMLDRKPQGDFPPSSNMPQQAASASGSQAPAQPAPSQPEEIPTIQIDENQDEVRIEDIPF
ncbi:MAG: single-stranded DNA-binding protein [Candidatus Moranbacteria bacterium]|nr:single-stranded DNA-binding protein [Candidatus Moranbacteria bacterium]